MKISKILSISGAWPPPYQNKLNKMRRLRGNKIESIVVGRIMVFKISKSEANGVLLRNKLIRVGIEKEWKVRGKKRI